MKQLLSLYGKPEEFESHYSEPKEWQPRLHWHDLPRYSSRQKTRMKLGGFMGKIFFSGSLLPFEEALLSAAELFHLGKNTSFGLGRIEVNDAGEGNE